MQCGAHGALERESAAPDEDAQRREERPEEPITSVAERMAVVRGAGTAEHADEQEHADRQVGRVRRGLGAKRNGGGDPRGGAHRERFDAVHAEGCQDTPASGRGVSPHCRPHDRHPRVTAGERPDPKISDPRISV